MRKIRKNATTRRRMIAVVQIAQGLHCVHLPSGGCGWQAAKSWAPAGSRGLGGEANSPQGNTGWTIGGCAVTAPGAARVPDDAQYFFGDLLYAL